MLMVIPSHLKDDHIFFTAGGFLGEHRNKCLCVRKAGVPQELAQMQRRQIYGYGFTACILVVQEKLSDTDIYHIGLPIIQEDPSTEVYIELHGRRRGSHRYLHLNKFIYALHSDPDLAQVSPGKRASVVQAVYILTGCDYISYFKLKELAKSF